MFCIREKNAVSSSASECLPDALIFSNGCKTCSFQMIMSRPLRSLSFVFATCNASSTFAYISKKDCFTRDGIGNLFTAADAAPLMISLALLALYAFWKASAPPTIPSGPVKPSFTAVLIPFCAAGIALMPLPHQAIGTHVAASMVSVRAYSNGRVVSPIRDAAISSPTMPVNSNASCPLSPISAASPSIIFSVVPAIQSPPFSISIGKASINSLPNLPMF